MRESLFSPLWHRYSLQRPQLRSHVTVQAQQYRDQTWYLLINDTSGSHYRINDIAYQFIGRCDGHYSVQQVWDSLLETLGDNAPTQDEIIHLLTELDQQDLLRYEVMLDVTAMFRRKRNKVSQKRRTFINPFAFRLPLWDPSKFLDKLAWLQKLIFNPITLLLWIITVVTAALIAAANWNALSQHASSYMTTPTYLFLAWVSFPFIKFLHEAGHALAVRHWGGQVKETGITLFVLVPAPYVDASAASAFRNRWQRVIVGAMGIMVELLLAALALTIWLNTQSGLVRDMAFITMFICSVSSLLFNGNPLLRFDAYYILCDAFDLPNLAGRSRQYWTNLIKRLVLGKTNIIHMALAAGERKWLVAYAPLSIVYALILMSFIVLWLGTKSVVVAVLAGLVAVTNMIIQPLFTTVANVIASAAVGTSRYRATLVIAAAILISTVMLFIIPAPYNTMAQGVVWIPEQAQIRPASEGFIKEIRVAHGLPVGLNQILLVLEDPELIAQRDGLNNQLNAMQVERYNLLFDDPVRAASIGEQMEKVNAELNRITGRINGLVVRSQAKGNLVMPHQVDLINTFVKKGVVLGYVLDKNMIKVRAAVPEPAAALVQQRLQSVQVRAADHPNQTINANIIMNTPAVTHTLPSPALGDLGGGRYATDPEDKEGITAIEPLVLIDLSLPSTALERIGTRVSVRFNHGYEPLAMQVYRQLQQLFLRHFSTSH